MKHIEIFNKELINKLLKDIKIELDDEFDRNFERKAFFNTAWPSAKFNTTGSLLMRTGALRKSIQSKIIGINAIKWESSLEYADIHNSGRIIMVTAKMKSFFWYRYRLASGGIYSIKTKKKSKNAHARKMSIEAIFWKTMALKPVGSIINIPKRQFIGDHPIVHQSVKTVCDEWFNTDVKHYIDSHLSNIFK